MSISLESQPCPSCRAENSVHINNCHTCGQLLPWAGSDLTQVGFEPQIKSRPTANRSKAILFYGLAAFFFVSFVTNFLLKFFIEAPPAVGVVSLFAAGAFWKLGDNTLMDVKE